MINYGFDDPDIQPYLRTLIQVMMEKEVKIADQVCKYKDKENFIEEVITNLNQLFPTPPTTDFFAAKNLMNQSLMPFLIVYMQEKLLHLSLSIPSILYCH